MVAMLVIWERVFEEAPLISGTHPFSKSSKYREGLLKSRAERFYHSRMHWTHSIKYITKWARTIAQPWHTFIAITCNAPEYKISLWSLSKEFLCTLFKKLQFNLIVTKIWSWLYFSILQLQLYTAFFNGRQVLNNGPSDNWIKMAQKVIQ